MLTHTLTHTNTRMHALTHTHTHTFIFVKFQDVLGSKNAWPLKIIFSSTPYLTLTLTLNLPFNLNPKTHTLYHQDWLRLFDYSANTPIHPTHRLHTPMCLGLRYVSPLLSLALPLSLSSCLIFPPYGIVGKHSLWKAFLHVRLPSPWKWDGPPSKAREGECPLGERGWHGHIRIASRLRNGQGSTQLSFFIAKLVYRAGTGV